MTRITILTGAGVSAESGLGTFRDLGGIWTQVRLEEVATPEAFAADPARVHDFYNARRAQAAGAKPNAAHRALARLQAEWPHDVLLVTQNIDGLHERAGSRDVLHMHGAIDRCFCAYCETRADADGDLSVRDACGACQARGGMRPDVVWFGEMPYHMDRIEAALAETDLFISIGTSGTVYPAAGFVAQARIAGAATVELTLEPTGNPAFGVVRAGPATETVPILVEALLSGSNPREL